MSLLLDTNVLVWWLNNDLRLSAELRDKIRNELEVMVSIVSPWELHIKVATGKFRLPERFDERLGASAVTLIYPTLDDTRLAGSLPLLHRDPFDRMIVAQAMNRQAILISGDRRLAQYGVRLIEA